MTPDQSEAVNLKALAEEMADMRRGQMTLPAAEARSAGRAILALLSEQQVESGRLRKALLAIETVQEASFIEWAEKIAPSKRGEEDDDEARKESKSAVWTILDEAARDLREALSPSPAQAEGGQ